MPSHSHRIPCRLARSWLGLGVLLALPLAAAAAERPAYALSAAWDSAYVSEGRDNLGEGGLLSGAFDVSWRGFGISGWVARGESIDYREINIGLGYSFAVGPVGASVGYTRLEFDGAGEAPGDNEWAMAVSVPIPGALELTLGGRYSTNADGAFFDVILRRPWMIGTAGVIVGPYLAYGVDHGYASAEHDGPNHLEGGVSLEWPIRAGVVVSLYAAHCWAQRDVELDGLGDVTWGGVRVGLGY